MWRWAIAVLVAAACGGGEAPDGDGDGGRRVHGEARVGGQVVSTVDGVPITLDEVRSTARETGLAPRDALRRLEDRLLLAAEAARRGYADRPEVREAGRKAAVQALLVREVEEPLMPRAIPEEAVRELWERRSEYHRPERRRVDHVLAKVGPDALAASAAAARAIAVEAIGALASTGADAALAEYDGATRDGIEVVVEHLEPMASDAAIEEPFLRAVFALEGPGVVAEPVRTRYGWHAIRVVEIEPAAETPFEDAEEALRAELVTDARRRRVEALVEELSDAIGVEIDERRVERALREELLHDSGAAR